MRTLLFSESGFFVVVDVEEIVVDKVVVVEVVVVVFVVVVVVVVLVSKIEQSNEEHGHPPMVKCHLFTTSSSETLAIFIARTIFAVLIVFLDAIFAL